MPRAVPCSCALLLSLFLPALLHSTHFPVQTFHTVLPILPRFGIGFPPQKLLLAQQLPPVFEPPRIQCSRVQRCQHRASRFPFMTTISEAALCGQRINVRKCLHNAVFRVPHLHLAPPGRVHQQGSSRKNEKFPCGRGVPSRAITLPTRPHSLHRLPQQPVRDRRLAHSGRAQQHQRVSRPEELLNLLKSLPCFRANNTHCCANRDALHVSRLLACVLASVSFVQHNDWLRS